MRAARTATTPTSPSLTEFPAPEMDTLWIDAEDPAGAARRLREDVPALVRAMGLEPEEHLLVMSPMRRGPLGTNQLNEMLRPVLRKSDARGVQRETDGAPAAGRWGHDSAPAVGVGDRVMQKKNNYDFGVVNGDVGHVADVGTDGSVLVVFTSPAPQIDGVPQGGGGMFGGLFGHDMRTVRYSAAEARRQLELAYAVTVHKAQGSEWPVVVACAHTSHAPILTRGLLYTAVSRAQRLLVVVGSRRAVRMAVNKDAETRRHTMLAGDVQRAVLGAMAGAGRPLLGKVQE